MKRILFTLGCVLAAASLSGQTLVRTSSATPFIDPGQYDAFATPGLIKASNGNILQMYHQGLVHVGSRAYEMMRVSTNNGTSWTAYNGGTQVNNVFVTNFGSGYTSGPTITLSGNATATAAAPVAGMIPSVTVTTIGTGYDEPANCTASGGGGTGFVVGTGAVNGPGWAAKIETAYVVNPGSGYTSAPTITCTPYDGNGTGLAITAGAPVTGIPSISITSAGSGYTSAPSCSVSGGGGTGMTCQARTDWCTPYDPTTGCLYSDLIPASDERYVAGGVTSDGAITLVYQPYNLISYIPTFGTENWHQHWLYSTRSTDNGVTWSRPKLLNTPDGTSCTVGFPSPTGTCFWGDTYGPLIVVPGVGVAVFSIYANGTSSPFPNLENLLIWSYDDGATYGVGTVVGSPLNTVKPGYTKITNTFGEVETALLYVGSNTLIGFGARIGPPTWFATTNLGETWTITQISTSIFRAGVPSAYSAYTPTSDYWPSPWIFNPGLSSGVVTALIPERVVYARTPPPPQATMNNIRAVTFLPSSALASLSNLPNPQVLSSDYPPGETSQVDSGYGSAVMISPTSLLYAYYDEDPIGTASTANIYQFTASYTHCLDTCLVGGGTRMSGGTGIR